MSNEMKHFDVDMLTRRPDDVKLECLVLMPMLPGYEGIREAVASAVAASGTLMRRLDEILPDPEWQLWLVDAVLRADLVVADVTDHNPFVMYELGLAHSRRLPTIIIIDERNARVPATVLGSPFLTYGEDLIGFKTILASHIQRMAAERSLPNAERDNPTDKELMYLYQFALDLLDRFRAQTHIAVDTVPFSEFVTRLRVAAARGDRLPDRCDVSRFGRHLLPRLIKQADETGPMKILIEWLLSVGVEERSVSTRGLANNGKV